MSDLASVRLRNTLTLFDEFVGATVAHGAAGDLRGLERLFAERLRISPSYWSQLKSRERHIGEKLARQFESLAAKPAGWLDEVHPAPARAGEPTPMPRDDDERLAVALFLAAYRHDPRTVKQQLLAVLQSQMTSPESATVAPMPLRKIPHRPGLTKVK